MATKNKKNSWKFTHGFVNRRGEIVLRFKNQVKNKFTWKIVEIPAKSGAIKIEYQTSTSRGWKTFAVKRSKNMLAKYRPFKKYVR